MVLLPFVGITRIHLTISDIYPFMVLRGARDAVYNNNTNNNNNNNVI
jgi:hypothetical protein